MAIYSIFEGNMERLQKKLTTIRNKCAKYGCSFSFKEIGEEFREVETDDNKKKIARFVIIDAEGTAQLNGWVCDQIAWLWKFRYITHEELARLTSKVRYVIYLVHPD